jgi:TetR/AcrR family transcriptional regulator, transcriptional repressor for nem operon
MTSRNTREALLNAGLELFLEGGYDFAGTHAILARAQAPRGSFYHHFEHKEAFALAVAEHYYALHLPVLDRLLSDETHAPLTRLRRYFEAMQKEYRHGGWAGGCLLGMLGQELADRDPGARDVLATLFGRWRHRIAACVREARDRGELEADVDCDELAGFLLDGWEGALIRMKLKKSGAPLEAFIRVTFDRVLAPRGG